MILDEATSGLDGETAGEVEGFVRRLASKREGGGGGMGVLAVTHERGMMEACGDVVVVGDQGRVVERGAFGELMGREGGELRRLMGGGG